MKKLLLVFLSMVLIFATAACKPSNDEILDKAYNASKLFVNDYLTSPYSAKYPTPGTAEARGTVEKDNKCTIISYVDSQNGFGAMLRTHFYIVLLPKNDKFSKWECISLVVWTAPDKSDMKIIIDNPK